jgi:hypothetical protein
MDLCFVSFCSCSKRTIAKERAVKMKTWLHGENFLSDLIQHKQTKTDKNLGWLKFLIVAKVKLVTFRIFFLLSPIFMCLCVCVCLHDNMMTVVQQPTHKNGEKKKVNAKYFEFDLCEKKKFVTQQSNSQGQYSVGDIGVMVRLDRS